MKKRDKRAVVVGLTAKQDLLHQRSHDRHGVADVGADRGAPVAQLLEHQAVAGESEQQRADEQRHADHPVQLTRPPVRAGEEHPHLVKDDGGDHQRRAPFVQAAQIPPERGLLGDVAHGLVGRGWRRLVVERQQDAGDDLHDEEVRRRAAEREPPAFQVVRHRLVRHRRDGLQRHGDALAEPVARGAHARLSGSCGVEPEHARHVRQGSCPGPTGLVIVTRPARRSIDSCSAGTLM